MMGTTDGTPHVGARCRVPVGDVMGSDVGAGLRPARPGGGIVLGCLHVTVTHMSTNRERVIHGWRADAEVRPYIETRNSELWPLAGEPRTQNSEPRRLAGRCPRISVGGGV